MQPYKKDPQHRKLYRHIIYVVPTCANPSGKTMPLKRREGLVRLARKYDCLVVCDDVYDFLQWPTSPGEPSNLPPSKPLPRLSDIDASLGPADNDPGGFGYAVSNGSFSKIVGPGVRTGWMASSPAFAYGLSQTGSSRSGGAPSQLSATFMRELLRNGDLDRQLETVTRPALQRRHRLIMDAIREHISPFGINVRETSLLGSSYFGGYFVWFSLPNGLSAKAVADRALRTENLIIAHGGRFEVYGDEESARFARDIRLCFSWEPEDVVVEGVERLARVLKDMVAKPCDRWEGSHQEKGTGDVEEFK